MTRHRSAPFLFASLLAAAAAAPTPAAAVRLPADVVPVRQSLFLRLDPARPEYSGSARIEVEVRERAERVRFHAEGLTLDRVELRRAVATLGGARDGAGGPLTVAAGAESAGVVTLVPSAPLEPGGYVLDLAFSNAFDTRATSLYRVEHDGLAYVFTQFEADEARRAFPCWDEPSFKIPWQVTLEVPDGLLAVANTRVAGDTADATRRRVTFAESPPMPSYLLALAVGPFDTLAVPGTRVPCRIVTPRGGTALAGEAARMTPPLLAALERWFEGPYPYDKLDLVAAPEFWYGAMENPGAVVFADRSLLVPADAPGERRRRLAELIAHELAHMWFGNWVTMAWWDDLWLNEAFATWLGGRVAEQVFPGFPSGLAALDRRAAAMRADARPGARAIRRPVVETDNLAQLADVLAYHKGRAVLDMFEGWLGPEAFRDGVLDYLHDRPWGSASADDLWRALSAAQRRGATRLTRGLFDAGDVAKALPTFLDQPGVPLVSVERDGHDRLRLRQRRFLRAGIPDTAGHAWRLPVFLAWGEGAMTRRRTVMLTRRELTVRLDGLETAEWIHPNAGETGYYRWSLALPELRALAARSPDARPARERVALPDHLAALLAAGELGADAFLAALEPLFDDPEPRVVRAALEALEPAREAWATGGAAADFSAWLRHALAPALARTGTSPAPGEDPGTADLRARLVEALAAWGDDPVALALGASVTRRLLGAPDGPAARAGVAGDGAAAAPADDDAGSAPPSGRDGGGGAGAPAADAALEEVAPAIAALRGDRALLEACIARFEAARAPAERGRWLRAIGSFRDPALVDAALDWVERAPLRPQETLAVPFALTAHPATRGRAWRFVEERWAWIAARVPPMALARLARLAGGCEPARVEAARRFLADPVHRGSGWERTLAETAEDVDACAELRAREGARASAWLRAAAAGAR